MIGTLSQKQVADFRQLYEKHFGEKISEEEATRKGMRLIQLIRAVVSHVNENDYESETTK